MLLTIYHLALMIQGEVITFKSRPTLKGLLNQFARLHKGVLGISPPNIAKPPEGLVTIGL